MYVYQADTWCDACGEKLCSEVPPPADADPSDEWSYDSDDWPKWAPAEATDSPDHCAAGAECAGDAVNLGDWGLAPDAPLYGAETRTIGELLSDGLTDAGAELTAFMLERERTPYQEALHRFWTATFADDLN